MPKATCFEPDGRPVSHDNGEPLTYEGRDDHRVFISAQRAWWPGSRNGRCTKEMKTLDPAKLRPPPGAVIAIDGIPTWRWERVPVFDAAGEVVATKLDWVNIRKIAEDAEEQGALVEMRARVARERAVAEGELVGGKAVDAERRVTRAPKGSG